MPTIPTEGPMSPSSEHERQPTSPTDLASFLEEQQQAVRRQFTVRPLTDAERQASEDVRWAHENLDVQVACQGEFVVPYRRTIVAHGHNAARVLEEAARKTGLRPQVLPLVGVLDPLLDIPG
jgi:hypothetical protein